MDIEMYEPHSGGEDYVASTINTNGHLSSASFLIQRLEKLPGTYFRNEHSLACGHPQSHLVDPDDGTYDHWLNVEAHSVERDPVMFKCFCGQQHPFGPSVSELSIDEIKKFKIADLKLSQYLTTGNIYIRDQKPTLFIADLEAISLGKFSYNRNSWLLMYCQNDFLTVVNQRGKYESAVRAFLLGSDLCTWHLHSDFGIEGSKVEGQSFGLKNKREQVRPTICKPPAFKKRTDKSLKSSFMDEPSLLKLFDLHNKTQLDRSLKIIKAKRPSKKSKGKNLSRK